MFCWKFETLTNLFCSEKGDILTEMRFYVPNTELEIIQGQKREEEEKKKPQK